MDNEVFDVFCVMDVFVFDVFVIDDINDKLRLFEYS